MNYLLLEKPQTFATLAKRSVAIGREKHGLKMDFSDFVNVPEPIFVLWQKNDPDPDAEAFPIWIPDGTDFHLKPESNGVDVGEYIPNINDDYLGKAPVLKALEGKSALLLYCPRLQ